MPAASSSVPKQRLRLLTDCESHLKFLSESLERLQHEVDRYKQLAAGLRILVCSTRSNKPLLLDLLDDYGLTVLVHPMPRTASPTPVRPVSESLRSGSPLKSGSRSPASPFLQEQSQPGPLLSLGRTAGNHREKLNSS